MVQVEHCLAFLPDIRLASDKAITSGSNEMAHY